MEINPRIIRDDKFHQLKTSILRDPEFMLRRPVLVNRVGKKNFIYGGSQRYRACVDLSWAEVPCMVSENLSPEVVKARMVKDNVHAGHWSDEKLMDFPDSDLAFLSLDKMGDELDFSMDNVAENKPKPKSEGGGAQENLSVGQYTFLLVFGTELEKAQFEMAMTNLPTNEGQTAEQYIAQKLLEQYDNS